MIEKFLPQFGFILLSAFVTLYISEYMKKPSLEFDSVRTYYSGEIQKFCFRVKNKEGKWFLERHAAQDCRVALAFPKPQRQGGLTFKNLRTKLLWNDESFGTDFVEHRNIYSGETADAYGLRKYEGDYYYMHTEERIHEDSEDLDDKEPVSEKYDKFLLIVKCRNGDTLKKEFEIEELESISEDGVLQRYP